MFLVVGLGNPGAKYKNTYHNVGFGVADALASSLKIRFAKTECDARVAKGNYKGVDFVVAKPQTYMNLSGEAVKKLVRAYDIDPATSLVVCYDDVDLPLGAMRLRDSGSAGTHNGMRNIVAELNTENFLRLRVGTRGEALSSGEVPLIDFVLSKIPYDELLVLKKSAQDAAISLKELIEGKPLARVQEKLNRR